MYRKIGLLTLGFVMIALGVTGIATSLVGQKTKADLQQIEKSRQETMAAAMEEQRVLDEKRQEVERLSQDADAERKRLEEERRAIEKDRRALDETYRSKMSALETQRKALTEARTAPPEAVVAGKGHKHGTKHSALSGKGRKPEKGTVSTGRHHKGRTMAAAKVPVQQDEPLRQIARKAGLEAARLVQPVQYQSRRTGELILAEPFDFRPGSVRVRVRVWRNQRLVEDTVMNFSEAFRHGPGRPHA